MKQFNITSTHRELIYGATSNFVFIPKKDLNENSITNAINVIIFYAANGYVFTNAERILKLDNNDLIRFQEEFELVIKSKTKEAFFLRKSFRQTFDLAEYTMEDKLAILAQYSLTYGWAESYKNLTDENPETILSDYVGDSLDKESTKFPSKQKEITIMYPTEYENYILSILESKIPLREHQKQIVESIDFSSFNSREPVYAIKSTKALVQTCVYKQGETPFISSLDEMQRFILSNCQKEDNGEDYSGQILKPMLKTFKFYMPTRMKKFILDWFNKKITESKMNNLVEIMYSNEQWWKRMFLHAHWCNEEKFNKRYPNVKLILNLLYNKDRHWTFNSRYTRSTSSGDYASAIEILSEKPGLLMRNLVMYCKYTKGVLLPVKESKNNEEELSNNETHLTIPIEKKSKKIVVSDGSVWLKESLPDYLIKNKPTIKNIWQVIETLMQKDHEKEISEREVQGKNIKYSTPIPAINIELRDEVVYILSNYIKSTNTKKNTKLGKIYLQPELKGVALQYSGATENSLSISGSYLSPGTIIPLPETDMITFGVCWKDIGNGSADLDLSSSFIFRDKIKTCYYGDPELKYEDEIIATSSGDITSCGTNMYSAEFIDIDLNLAEKYGVEKIFNAITSYRGGTVDKYDTHIFLSSTNKENRIIPGRKIDIDLSKQDYAVKLNDEEKSYIGMSIDIKNRTMKALSIPLKSESYDNVRILLNKFSDQIENKPVPVNTLNALEISVSKSQMVDSAELSDFSIGISDDYDLNVLKNAETLQKILF